MSAQLILFPLFLKWHIRERITEYPNNLNSQRGDLYQSYTSKKSKEPKLLVTLFSVPYCGCKLNQTVTTQFSCVSAVRISQEVKRYVNYLWAYSVGFLAWKRTINKIALALPPPVQRVGTLKIIKIENHCSLNPSRLNVFRWLV